MDVYSFYLTIKGNLDTSQGNRKFWHKLWSMDINSKWKLFVWRLLNKAIAMNSNLLKRNIPVQEKIVIYARSARKVRVTYFEIAP